MAVLHLYCCVGFVLIVGSKGYSLVMVHRLLSVVTSLVVEHGPSGVWASVVVAHRLSSYSSRAQALEHRLSSCGAWA